MKPKIISIAALLTATSLGTPAFAENPAHTKQLFSTKECLQCDLTGAGLVTANLIGAKMSGTNLSGANLSRANLTGADLRGVNLSGANLYGANLTGANLTGANLTGTDLRASYLLNANFNGVNLNTAYLEGAMGVPANAATPELLYKLALIEARKQDHKSAIDYFNQSLTANPKFALAYLGRSVSRYRLGDEAGAVQDAQLSAALFSEQENVEGYELSLNFIKAVQAPKQAAKLRGGGPNILNLIGGISSLLFKILF